GCSPSDIFALYSLRVKCDPANWNPATKNLGEPFGSPFSTNWATNSELYSDAKLDLAHQGVGRDAGDLAITRAAVNAAAGLAKIHMVEHVEELSSKLSIDALGDAEVLKERKIGVEEMLTGKALAVILE